MSYPKYKPDADEQGSALKQFFVKTGKNVATGLAITAGATAASAAVLAVMSGGVMGGIAGGQYLNGFRYPDHIANQYSTSEFVQAGIRHSKAIGDVLVTVNEAIDNSVNVSLEKISSALPNAGDLAEMKAAVAERLDHALQAAGQLLNVQEYLRTHEAAETPDTLEAVNQAIIDYNHQMAASGRRGEVLDTVEDGSPRLQVVEVNDNIGPIMR